MQLGSPAGQVARTTTHRTRKPGRVAAADRVGVPSSDRHTTDGFAFGALEIHAGPGCSWDPPRARLQLRARLHAQPRTEHANRAGLQLRAGLEFHRVTTPGRFCNRGTSCNKTPPVLQSRYIMQQNATEHANRAGLQLRNGSQFDRVIYSGTGCSWDPWGPGCSWDPLRAECCQNLLTTHKRGVDAQKNRQIVPLRGGRHQGARENL